MTISEPTRKATVSCDPGGVWYRVTIGDRSVHVCEMSTLRGLEIPFPGDPDVMRPFAEALARHYGWKVVESLRLSGREPIQWNVLSAAEPTRGFDPEGDDPHDWQD